MLEHSAAVTDLPLRQIVAKRRWTLDDDISQSSGSHALAGGTEALEAEHMRAVRADVAVTAVFGLTLAALSTEMMFATTMATVRHGELLLTTFALAGLKACATPIIGAGRDRSGPTLFLRLRLREAKTWDFEPAVEPEPPGGTYRRNLPSEPCSIGVPSMNSPSMTPAPFLTRTVSQARLAEDWRVASR